MNDIRSRFPFYLNNEEISYLDSAASSLKLGSMIDKLTDYYQNNGSNIHRGVYKLAYQATIDYEATRELVAKFINSETSEVIFTKGTTDALNKLANALSDFINKDDEIITSELEHHSNFIPWQIIANHKQAKLVFVPLNENNEITIENIEKSISSKTKVITLTHVSNTLGNELDIKAVSKIAKQNNIITVFDVAQSISHTKIDVKDIDCDFIAFSAHKMYGPNGVGVLYGKEALLKQIKPFEYGGEMAHIVNKDTSTYKDIPHKFEAGTPVIAEVIAFSEAIKFINEIGLENIKSHEMMLRNYTLNKLKPLDFIEIYNQNANNPILTFNIKNIHPHDAASILDQNNVCVRAGHHCAQLVLAVIKQIATLRASFAIYNTKEDCDKLISALIEANEFFNGF